MVRHAMSAAAAVAVALAASTAARADPRCYDVKLRARAIDQIPSDIGDCGNECIVMAWPWFVELKVRRVLDGASPGENVWTLAVQHTYVMSRNAIWLLRRNSAGSYNIIWPDKGVAPTRCPPGVAPARAYIGVEDGRRLDDLREGAIRRYGHFRK